MSNVEGRISLQHRTTSLLGVVGLVVILTVCSVGPSYALDDSSGVTADDVDYALTALDPGFVETATEAQSTEKAAAVVEGDEGAVSVPRVPSDGVDLSADGTAMVFSC